MYGYTPPKQPEPGQTRLRICESEVSAYAAQFPQLSRDEILDVMRNKGPMRANVESELRTLHEARRKSAPVPPRVPR